MRWTQKQKEVIDARGCNLLVSAAAGSGKTAVLVERIIQLICSEENPVDIDHLLVMTFTNAAAAEMRERISLAIEKKLMEQPEREHLQVQAALVHRAQITTIDSFCLNLIRDHFNLLDIDPAFRIGDEGELMLLKADVMQQMLEEYYESADPGFIRFVETYATGKSDSGIEDYIMQVYTFSQSNPFPEEWFLGCRKELLELEEGKLAQTSWMKFLMADMKNQVKELEGQIKLAMEVCQTEGGPEVYLSMLQADLEMLRSLAGAKDYRVLNRRLEEASFGRLGAARGKHIDLEKKEFAAACRDRVKKAVGNLKKLYGRQTEEEAAETMKGSKEVVLKLLELAEEFHKRYQESKKDKNIVDFNDLEHKALEILVKKEDGRICYTTVADELSHRYAEILVDEYQDSNDVQETLIQSLSAERFGRPDVFMVGDVKQSIYKFRLARPELFMKKYEQFEEYTEENQDQKASQNLEDNALAAKKEIAEGNGVIKESAISDQIQEGAESCGKKIELRQNFRSRASVLNSINEVFFQIMTKNLGNIQYTDRVALHPGAVFEETQQTVGTPTELLLVDTGKKVMGPADEELEEYTSREMEAKLIASKIRQMTDPKTGLFVWDKEKGCYRLAEYGDMVILLRSLTGWTDSFLNVLTQEDIPAFAETGTGYFDTIEVETVLAMLAVIDNPMQDIPLASVLKSVIVGMENEEMAWMMAVLKHNLAKGQDRGVYGAISLVLGREWTKEGTFENRDKWCEAASKIKTPDERIHSIYEKLLAFSRLLGHLRKEAAYLPIHELIHRMYLRTGYYDHVSAMPAGEARKANLDMLIEKAWVYEKTSYRGLFHFIRYIERLKKYDTDFGEATSAGKSQQMVRIMSIHKSKGLEFPIVFLVGLGKPFNKQDVRGKLMIDGDLGIGVDDLDVETRVKIPTLKKNVLKRKMDLDNLGEELRVLYVAMTRAKEKLIMTATDRHLEKKLERWKQRTWDSRQIPYTILSTAGCYLDWLLMSQLRDSPLFHVDEILVEDLVGETVARKLQKTLSKEELKTMDLSCVYDEETEQFLKEQLSYEYPYEADINLHTKMSVSELKKQGQDADDKNSLFQPVFPAFLKETEETAEYEEEIQKSKSNAGGTVQGSAYHRVLELLDFGAIERVEDISRWLEAEEKEGHIAKETGSMVNSKKIWRFLQSSLGKRMKQAYQEKRLYREQQFIIGIPAREMNLGESEELVLIQGIIDAWIEEEDGLILIDYKTDRIKQGEEMILIKRYREQLEYYRRALEQMKGKRVKEQIIYSLALQKEIFVDRETELCVSMASQV